MTPEPRAYPSMNRRLSGKIVIVTGASRGLGRHCALGYGAEGATVVVAARSRLESDALPGTIDETAKLVEAAGGSAFPVACDVGEPASVQSMAATVLDRFGRIDVLMTNAAYFAPGTISTMTPQDWERQFRVNVHGVFYAIRTVLPAMIAQRGGTIINISSIAAQRASHYGVTKRTVEGMTLSFAEEQKANGIRVNSLRPVAAIETPGWINARDAEARRARANRVSPPDSYVEAAILLAMQSSTDDSGQSYTDAEVLKLFGDEASLARFRAMNAPVWSASLTG